MENSLIAWGFQRGQFATVVQTVAMRIQDSFLEPD